MTLRTTPMREIAALLQLLAMGQIYQFTLPDGRKYSVGLEVTGSGYGQVDGYVLAWMVDANGVETRLGYLDFALYRDTAHIKMIEVADAYKRSGVARGLMKVLRDEGGCPIDPGYTTQEGTPFIEQLQRENPDWFATPQDDAQDDEIDPYGEYEIEDA